MSEPEESLRRTPSGRTVVVTPVGDQDGQTLPRLQAELTAAYATPARALVVDLQHVRRLDGASVRALLDLHRDLLRGARDLMVVNVHPAAAACLRAGDAEAEMRVVTVERVLGPGWWEAGALRLREEAGGAR